MNAKIYTHKSLDYFIFPFGIRTGEKTYKKRYGYNSSRGQILDRVSIDQRPEVVDQRTRVGVFESDLIIGKKHKGALLTIVDRHFGFVMIENVGSKSKDAVKKASINALAPYKEYVIQLPTIMEKNLLNIKQSLKS